MEEINQKDNPTTSDYTIIINCERSEDPGQIYLLFTAASPVDIKGGILQDEPISLKELMVTNPSLTLTFGDTQGGRLYAGIGPFDNPPLPTGNQYYGWIEFTRLSTDPCVWINLSNVDILGLPLTVSGTDATGATYSLGYKKGVDSIRDELITQLKKDPGHATNLAIISCTGPAGPTSYTKIVGPNNKPSEYPSYEGYLDLLCDAKAKLLITSDIPGGTYKQETFTGGFNPSIGPSGVIISLLGDNGNTFQITKDQFIDTFVYGCGGGTVIWNGTPLRQNDVPPTGGPTPPQILHDSVFRELCVGINEGYFLREGINYSTNFPYYEPFINGTGSIYAQIIHNNSNSYGFPYSDNNLKVQALAGRTSTIQFNIISDDVAKDYGQGITVNPLNGGKYQFGFGSDSPLGNITMGDVRYLPNTTYGYGGFLPTFDDWYKMNFFGGETDQYIWLKTPGASGETGSIVCGGVLTQTAKFDDKNNVQWGAGTQWVTGATSPAKPT